MIEESLVKERLVEEKLRRECVSTIAPERERATHAFEVGHDLPVDRFDRAPSAASGAAAIGQGRCSLKGALLLWSAVLTCPCHFPLIVLLLLGESALGTYFHAHLVLLFGLSAVYFAVALLVGVKFSRK